MNQVQIIYWAVERFENRCQDYKDKVINLSLLEQCVKVKLEELDKHEHTFKDFCSDFRSNLFTILSW